jgi:Uma2 family endonuclease
MIRAEAPDAMISAVELEKLAEPMLFPGLTWQQFKMVEPLLEVPGVRLSFLDGVLEIRRMPGRKHEVWKERIGALLEAYMEYIEIDFTPTGSMTLERESTLVKREADKSYELGSDRERPDLAIEIVVTSGGINKLEAYKRLQIPEVWFWQNGRLSLHHLRTTETESFYEEINRSELLPGLDLELLKRCINLPNHTQSLKEFRQALSHA